MVEFIVSKFHPFSIFFWTPLDGHVLSMTIIPSDASHFRHSNNVLTPKVSLEKILMENIKNWSCKSYLGNKKPKATILAVTSLDAHPGFSAPIFVRDELSVQVKLRSQKNWVDINKFIQPRGKSCTKQLYFPRKIWEMKNHI